MPVPPVIRHWLCEANDRLGTRLIAAAPRELEETIRIDGPPARAKLNLGTTLGRIEGPRGVPGEMEPGLVIDLLHTTFMLNPTLRAVLIHPKVRTLRAFLQVPCCTFQSRRTRPGERNPPVGPRRMCFTGLDRMRRIV